MTKRDYLTRYLLIIKVLRNRKRATFDEINEYIRSSFEMEDQPKDISLRTFQRDKNEIRTIFKIDIRCNAHNEYYIADDEQTEDFNNRMLEAFDVFNSLSSTSVFSKYVLPEKRCSLGTEHIYGLLHAMQNEVLVEFTYHKYHEKTAKQRWVEPYSLKEFKGRWYLVSKDLEDGNIKTFGLDRISNLIIGPQKFVYPADFDAKALFRDSYGVINEQKGKPEEIILSIEPLQGKYLKSYPLHDSQRILVDNDDEFRISLRVHITHDFIMELLSIGQHLTVIQPVELITEITDVATKMIDSYKKLHTV
jgi:predicted DNA-binding transcriptional regulator YafY